MSPSTGDPIPMAVTLSSSRFGELEIPEESILEFPNGLIGLASRRYALLARSDESAFLWLHSADDPTLAVPVTNPYRFFPDFALDMDDDEAARLGIEADTDVTVYVTVRAAAALDEFTANLRAPIALVGNTGHQVINQAPNCAIRAPLFAGSEERPTKAA
jgi:flagellar assembly factor FliW